MKEKANLIKWPFIIIIMLVILCPITKGEIIPEDAEIKFDGGSGEPNDPYLISTAEQLKAIGDPNINNKCFMLIADIDLDPNLPGNKIIIVPFLIRFFGGTLDGNSHSISNMVIDSYTGISGGSGFSKDVGFISYLGLHAVVKDLQLQNITICSNGRTVGTLVAENAGKILRCSVTGNITGVTFVGGLV